MANAFTQQLVNAGGQPNNGVSQRGQHALRAYKYSLTTTGSYLYPTMDSLDLGALCFAAFIDNLTASGASTGLKFTPQISIDGNTWVNCKWKDEASTETVAGEVTIAQNTTQWVIINFASYPELACARFFRLKIHPSTSPGTASTPTITMLLK